VQTGLTRGAVVVIVGDIFQSTGFESRVFHALDSIVAPSELLLYKSYSISRARLLYETVGSSE
jgi:hypothetical protein